MNDTNKENAKISFIVPVYNVEKYIQRCIRSIMAQSYCDIEIILVDDGSPDESGAIIERFAKIDIRIKVIHQQNAGVSAARNAGLAAASGKYVLFIDGDDYIEREYAEYFLNLIQDNNADMAVNLNHFTISTNEQIQRDSVEVWDNMRVMEAVYLDKINVAVWNKMYRKDILDKYRVKFHNDIWFGEGMLFNIEYLQHVDRIAVGGWKVYHQVYNPGSAMRKFDLESQFCGLRSLDAQKAAWKKTTPQLEKAWKYHRRNFAEHILSGLINTNSVKSHKELYKKCRKAMYKNILLPWKVDIPLKMKARLTAFSFLPHIISARGRYKADKIVRLEEKLISK